MSPPRLVEGRVHELTGPAAPAFALLTLARQRIGGEIAACAPPPWTSALHPEAVARFFDPNRVLHVPCPLEGERLWAAETALRTAVMGAVLIVTAKTPTLTQFRRLQLAALSGDTLGLVIVSQPAASTAAETRWRCTPLHAGDGESDMRLHASLYKNKKGIVGSWVLNVIGETNCLHLDAAPAGEPVWPERIAG